MLSCEKNIRYTKMVLDIPRSISKFLVWWFYTAPKKIYTIFTRILIFANYELSFTVNLRLIFTPLYGDYSFIGRIIGFFTRIIFIVFGLVFIGFLGIVSMLAPIVWYLLLPFAFYYFDFWSIPFVLALYIAVTIKKVTTPDKKVSEVKKEQALDSFRPDVKRNFMDIVGKGAYFTNIFLHNPQISYLLNKSEMANKGLEDKISKTEIFEQSKIQNLAYDFAIENKSKYVEMEHLFMAVITAIPNIETILSGYGSELRHLKESAFWIVQRRDFLNSMYFWQDDYIMPPMGGFGHGLTGRVTPHLDAISRDFTKLVKRGLLPDIVGRDLEVGKIASTLGGANENILILGEPGCGKTSLVMGIAHRIMHGTEYKSLRNKRIVSLEMGGLISGARHSGEVASKLKQALDEVVASKDIILFIDEIHNLVSPVDNSEDFSTVYSILEPYLASSSVQFIGATNLENYRKYIEPIGSFSRLFQIFEVQEADFTSTLEILKHRAIRDERKYGVVITIPALFKIIKLSEKLIHDRVLPDKAIDILNRATNEARSTDRVVSVKIIEKIITEMTRVPVSAISDDESEKLLNIESEMKKRVIGQDHAIIKIANAIKRARVGIRDENKPIASFLFVGTTGVGKTETAKTLSETYFGDKKAMVRLDMSEYQSPDSIDKLIGTSDGKTKGILTEQIRTKPFVVLLLDEIEKAHQQVMLTFLQVLDDARLTDSSGKTVDFTNTIIIATSNVGTKQIQEITQRGGSYEEIEESAMAAVRDKFAPEFLNRFTGIIVYKPLQIEEVRKIANIMLANVVKRTQEKKIKITFSDELITELIKRGFSPEWGARPLARTIEESVETYVAENILKKEFKQGDTVTLGMEIFLKK